MKMRKIIAAGLAVALIASLSLTGCGQNDNSTKDNSNNSTALTDTAGNSDDTDAAAGSNGLDNTEFTNVSLPLTEEKQTLTIWMRNDVTQLNACGGDLNNSPFFQKLEELTNVHIEWAIPASGSEKEQMGLLFASGELPDIMYYAPGQVEYQDGLDAAVDDEYLLDLTPYLAEYAPNYLAAINNGGDELQKIVKTDAGRYVAMYTIAQEEQPPFYGYMVRQDWLDDLNLDTPVTIADWEEMLTQFKEVKGASAALSMHSYFLWELGAGMGAYGTFYQKDGDVSYSIYNDADTCKEYLSILNRWYSNGLIDPDFASSSAFWGDPVLINNDNCGAVLTMYTLPATTFKTALDNGAEFSAVTAPVKNTGDKINYRRPNDLTNFPYVVSTDCKNPELAIRWIDFLFSEAGALLANYGVEGETYTVDDNGEPHFTDLVLANPDGLSFDEALRIYTLAPSAPASYYDYTRELDAVPADAIEMCEVWNQATSTYFYPTAANMTAAENTEYSQIFSDIQTYVQENTLSFVTGAKSLDEFDDFVATLKSMNIERCIELKQIALDRYNNR